MFQLVLGDMRAPFADEVASADGGAWVADAGWMVNGVFCACVY